MQLLKERNTSRKPITFYNDNITRVRIGNNNIFRTDPSANDGKHEIIFQGMLCREKIFFLTPVTKVVNQSWSEQ